MKTTAKKIMGTLILVVAGIMPLMAQSPGLFQYQAILRDADQQPDSGRQIAVQVSILVGAENGSPLFSEIHHVRTGALGEFQFMVGDGDDKTGSIEAIEWGSGTHYMKVAIDKNDGNSFTDLVSTSQLVSVPYAMHAGNLDKPVKKLEVIEPEEGSGEEALFEVKRNDGSTVFAVYNEGVRVYVNEDPVKGVKGGFAVGGYQSGKGITNEYMRVTPDSVRVYVKEPGAQGKGVKGGFAVGGYQTGKAATTSLMHLLPQNYFIGHDAGSKNTTGEFNTFFGYEAGLSNTEGSFNLFQGHNAGYNNTIGVDNVFIGLESGYKNTEGEANIFIGKQAGYSNETGIINTFIGKEAGFSHPSGEYNTFIGFWSGRKLTSGNLNTFVGAQTGEFLVDGELNTIVGAYAGADRDFGDQNLFLGMSAGRGNTGSFSTIVGSQAGADNEDGSENIMVGFYSGTASSGSRNIFIGNNAGNTHLEGAKNTGSDNIFIGNGAGFDLNRSNRLIIDNSWGADSASALIYGETDNRVLVFNGRVGFQTYPTEYDYRFNGSVRVDGDFSPANLTLEDGLRFNGGWDPTSEFLETGNFISFAHPGFSEDFIGYKDNAFYFLDSPDGGDISGPDVHVGKHLYVGGSANFSGVQTGAIDLPLGLTAGGWLVTEASDERLKTEFRELNDALEKVLKMQGYSYGWKAQPEGDRDIGFKAGELQKVLPEAVFQNPVDGYLGVNYSRLPVILVEAIQEQQQIIEQKDRKIQELEERIKRVETAVGLAE